MIWPRSSPANCVRMPSMIGTFGPYTSPSITATRLPIWLSAIARLTATVVLPTPPFPAPTAMMFFTPATGVLAASTFDVERTCAVISISTAVTPGMAATACRACSRIWSFTGQAGVVSSIENATWPPVSMRRFLMNFSETISRLRSGSRTRPKRVKDGRIRKGRWTWIFEFVSVRGSRFAVRDSRIRGFDWGFQRKLGIHGFRDSQSVTRRIKCVVQRFRRRPAA